MTMRAFHHLLSVAAIVLLLLAGDAFAQGVGLGTGLDDLRPVGVSGVAPVYPSLTADNGSTVLTADDGSTALQAF